MIIILSGEPGSGKTYQAMGWEEPILYLDMENRTQKTLDSYYKDRVITVKKCMAYTKDFKENHIATLTNCENEFKGIDKFVTVVIDGISDIRDYAVTKWLSYAKSSSGAARKQPQNPGDWEEINDIVRNLLFPVINECRAKNIHLVMTAQFKDEYGVITNREGKKESVKVGRMPALKEWMMYNADTLIEMVYQKPNYKSVCTKSIVGCWSEDITDKSLYDVLIEKGV